MLDLRKEEEMGEGGRTRPRGRQRSCLLFAARDLVAVQPKGVGSRIFKWDILRIIPLTSRDL